MRLHAMTEPLTHELEQAQTDVRHFQDCEANLLGPVLDDCHNEALILLLALLHALVTWHVASVA